MIEFFICRAGVKAPQHINEYGGIVFYVPEHTWENKTCEIKPGGRVVIPSGVKFKTPVDVGLLLTNVPASPAMFGLVVDTQLVHTNNGNEILISLHSTNLEHSIFITENDGIAVGVAIYFADHQLQEGKIQTEDTTNG